MIGAGLAPAGTSPAGYGVITTYSEASGSDFVISSGVRQGEVGEVRRIDPLTGDYVIGPGGKFIGQDSTEQAVYLALSTVLGSSVNPSLGQSFSSQKVIGAGYVEKTVQSVKQALRKLTDSKRISIDSIQVQKDGTRLGVQINWTNLLTNKKISLGL